MAVIICVILCIRKRTIKEKEDMAERQKVISQRGGKTDGKGVI